MTTVRHPVEDELYDVLSRAQHGRLAPVLYRVAAPFVGPVKQGSVATSPVPGRLVLQLLDHCPDRRTFHAALTVIAGYVVIETTRIAADDLGLDVRELQSLQGMSEGLTNGEIGRRLHLSEDTVKTYNRRLFAKLGVKDRAHAVAVAYQRGVLDGAISTATPAVVAWDRAGAA